MIQSQKKSSTGPTNETINLANGNEILIVTEKTQNLHLNSPKNDLLVKTDLELNIKKINEIDNQSTKSRSQFNLTESPNEKANIALENAEFITNNKPFKVPLVIPDSPQSPNERKKVSCERIIEIEKLNDSSKYEDELLGKISFATIFNGSNEKDKLEEKTGIKQDLNKKDSINNAKLCLEKEMNTTKDDDDLLNQIPLTSICEKQKVLSKRKNSVIANQVIINEIESIKDLIFETQDNPVAIVEDIENQAKFSNSDSFVDDQLFIAAAETFEKKRQSSAFTELQNLNTTCLSLDVLKICDDFEKKSRLSAKKKANLNESKNLDRTKFQSLFSDPVPTKEFFLNDLEKKINLFDIKLSVISNQNDYENFNQSIKSKSTLSISLAIQKCQVNKPFHENEEFFFVHLNSSTNIAYKCFGLLVCFDPEKEKQIYFLVSCKSKIFMPYFKSLLERNDIYKIIFYSKENYKILNELFQIKLSMPCYDPIIAEWILRHQYSNIFQIKNNYCLKFNQPIESFTKNMLSCKNFQINTTKSTNDFVDLVKFASIQSLIGITSFKQIKVSLQLDSVWYYYAKIESEIALIAGQTECEGFGLSEKEFECQKKLLIS